MTLTRGHCLCGAVKFEFEGNPKWVAHCHCDSCRRQTSSSMATMLGVKVEQFDYLEGEPAVYESSPGVQRFFCPKCGSPMAFTDNKRWPGEVHLFIGTLEHPEAFVPGVHVNCAEQLPWLEILDDKPRFEHFGEMGEPALRRGPKKG